MKSVEIFRLKDDIRKEILGKLLEQAPGLREKRSLVIQEKLISCAKFKKADTIMSYVALPNEVDTAYLNKKVLEEGKRLVVPVIDMETQTIIASELKSIEDLVEGPYGIGIPRKGFEYVEDQIDPDLIVVPAVAYDRKNTRLGRGKGYYDKFLAGIDSTGTETVGLAFHFQIVDSLPADLHDEPVSLVISD